MSNRCAEPKHCREVAN